MIATTDPSPALTAPRSFELDDDTRVSRRGEYLFESNYTERWNVGPVPSGGYVMVVGLKALAACASQPDPVTVTGHFLRPASPGPVEIEVEPVRLGRGHSTLSARLLQNGKEHLRLLATFGDLTRAETVQPVYDNFTRPDLPPPDECLGSRDGDGMVPEIARRFDQRLDPRVVPGLLGNPTGVATMRGWGKFADERPLDVLSLALWADAFAPPVFNVLSPGWVPTIELTVHFRARPAPDGWLAGEFRSRLVSGDYLDEEGELFDARGRLVASSRQLAGVPRS